MADIKLVIKISEEDYDDITLTGENTINLGVLLALRKAVKNGTPLPKGHGRLIDADAFQMYCFNKNFDKRLSNYGLAIINMFLESQPTVIEPDQAESEE